MVSIIPQFFISFPSFHRWTSLSSETTATDSIPLQFSAGGLPNVHYELALMSYLAYICTECTLWPLSIYGLWPVPTTFLQFETWKSRPRGENYSWPKALEFVGLLLHIVHSEQLFIHKYYTTCEKMASRFHLFKVISSASIRPQIRHFSGKFMCVKQNPTQLWEWIYLKS